MPRTRAMGESPTGFRSLDMEKPIRKRKAAQSQGTQRQTRSASNTKAVGDKSDKDKSDKPTNSYVSSLLTVLKNTFDTSNKDHERSVAIEEPRSSPSKRKSADTPNEQRSTKRARAGEIEKEDKLVLTPPKRKSADTPDEQRSTKRARAGETEKEDKLVLTPPKRKSVDIPDEQRSTKRTRVGEIETEDKPVLKPQAEASAKNIEPTRNVTSHSRTTNSLNQNNIPDSRNNHTTTIATEDKPVLKPQAEASAKNIEPTRNVTSHIPTTNSLSQNNLPDSPNNQSTTRAESTSVLFKKTLTKEELLEKQQFQQTFHNIRRLDPAYRPKYEKALSECDDEEWYPQFRQRMMDISTLILPSDPEAVTWDYDSKAMFLTRTNESRGGPILKHNPFCPPPSQVTTRLLTQDSVIEAVSAVLDWLEKNPGAAVPTANEVSALLADFNLSKQVEAANKIIKFKKSLRTTQHSQRNTAKPVPSNTQYYHQNTTKPLTSTTLYSHQNKAKPVTTTTLYSHENMAKPVTMANPVTTAKPVTTTTTNCHQNKAKPVTPPNTTGIITADKPETSPATTTPSPQQEFPQQESEHLIIQPPSSHLPSSQAAEESRSWATALGCSAANFIRSPLSVFRSPNRRQDDLEMQTEIANTLPAVNPPPGIAPLGEATRATRSGQPRRASKPLTARARQEAETQLKRRRSLERSSREAEVSRAAQRARVRVEAGTVQGPVKRKTPVASTQTSSNTFSCPEYSDSDSDDSAVLEGLTRYFALPLWIPRGYKSLAANGECNAGTEFDLPKWVRIRSPAEVNRLAESWNERVLGPDHRVAEDLRGLPTVGLAIPLLVDSWLSQEEIADRLAFQQEFEELESMWDRGPDDETPEELYMRKIRQAGEYVRQRKESAKLEETLAQSRAEALQANQDAEESANLEKALAQSRAEWDAAESAKLEEALAQSRADRDVEAWVRADWELGAFRPTPNPLQESSLNRINQALQKARENAERYKPKVPSRLRIGKNMSPIQEKNEKACTTKDIIDYQEVINSMKKIKDGDIIAELFPQGQ